MAESSIIIEENDSNSVWYKLAPTLFERDKISIRKLFSVGIIISIFTSSMVVVSLMNEMSGIIMNRKLDVSLFMIVISFLVISSILLYPFLIMHYRYRILFEEEVKRLNMKYHEGLQEFQRRRGQFAASKGGNTSISIGLEKLREIVDKMSFEFSDFAYIQMTLIGLLSQRWSLIGERIEKGLQTYEQIKKDLIREIINVTVKEILEDSTYDLSSYEMPIAYCMLSVSTGIISISLIPFLGKDTILLGTSTINLTWASGGFIGAYIYSLYPFFQRYTRRDLPPRAFLHYALKIFLGMISVTIFGNIFLTQFSESLQFSFAAVLGSVPFYLLALAREHVFSRIELNKNKGIGDMDVITINGITYEYAERLHEEGVMNVQNLAFIDVEIMSKRTMFNRNMLFDWKDEAILRLLTGNIIIKENEEQILYQFLFKKGIYNVSTLANYLDCKRTQKGINIEYHIDPDSAAIDDLYNLLKLTDSEYKYLIKKICIQGKMLLGELSKPSITAFASMKSSE